MKIHLLFLLLLAVNNSFAQWVPRTESLAGRVVNVFRWDEYSNAPRRYFSDAENHTPEPTVYVALEFAFYHREIYGSCASAISRKLGFGDLKFPRTSVFVRSQGDQKFPIPAKPKDGEEYLVIILAVPARLARSTHFYKWLNRPPDVCTLPARYRFASMGISIEPVPTVLPSHFLHTILTGEFLTEDKKLTPWIFVSSPRSLSRLFTRTVLSDIEIASMIPLYFITSFFRGSPLRIRQQMTQLSQHD